MARSLTKNKQNIVAFTLAAARELQEKQINIDEALKASAANDFQGSPALSEAKKRVSRIYDYFFNDAEDGTYQPEDEVK